MIEISATPEEQKFITANVLSELKDDFLGADDMYPNLGSAALEEMQVKTTKPDAVPTWNFYFESAPGILRVRSGNGLTVDEKIAEKIKAIVQKSKREIAGNRRED